MSRTTSCSRSDARRRVEVARAYLEVSQLAGEEEGGFANMAAGNAVLAGIAAADAITCATLGKRHRGQDHRGAVQLLGTVTPNGAQLARHLETILAAKDLAHYGDRFITPSRLKNTRRAAERLVDAAEALLD